jgi:hypothetical protein
MKKELKTKKLTLGKMTVARLSQQKMRSFNGGIDTMNGGNDTKGTIQSPDDATTSIVNDPNNPCGTVKTVKTKV